MHDCVLYHCVVAMHFFVCVCVTNTTFYQVGGVPCQEEFVV